MANLSSALNYALAGLSVSTAQSTLVSRNISSAGDENYTRRTAEIHTLPNGVPGVSDIKRSTDRQLLDKLLLSNSEASGKQVTLDAIARMSALTGDPQDDHSISASIGQLQLALQDYESNPSNSALGRTALEAARSVTLKLNSASDEIAAIRSEADTAIADATQRVNNLLAQFKVVNDSIVRGQGTPAELSDNLDQRDSILKLLSEDIGIRTSIRPNNDVVIYAEGGAVLFEGSPREVGFSATGMLQPDIPGDAVFIDGVAVTGGSSPMPAIHGKLAAYATIRDQTAVQFSQQLDQLAAGLIRGFAEKAPSSPAGLPDVEGLFTGSGTLPSPATSGVGLASSIAINPSADPEQGGSVLLLRDGGFGGAAYVSNTLSQAGYQKRLGELAAAVDSIQAFGGAGGIGGTISLKELSLQSASWLSSAYQGARSSFDVASASQTRAGEALGRMSGVSIDQEMAALLDLEKSYQASSKVLSIVNAMLATLMEAVK